MLLALSSKQKMALSDPWDRDAGAGARAADTAAACPVSCSCEVDDTLRCVFRVAGPLGVAWEVDEDTEGPPTPSPLVRFLPASQYSLELASGIGTRMWRANLPWGVKRMHMYLVRV